MIKKILILILFFSNSSYAKESENLTIFAESNLAVPLVKIIRKYSQERHVIVSINFRSSFDLIKKIDEGEPADIFISSHNDWINSLKQKGLIDIYSISNISEDSLVLITSNKNKKFLESKIDKKNLSSIFTNLGSNGYALIAESEYKSLGKYSSKIVKKYNIKPNVVFRKLNEDKKSIIDFVAEDKNLFALVLESAVLPKDDVNIVAKIPDIEINYQASAIAGNNMELARDFITFLEEVEFKKYF
jgi:molybdenum ABC transporter molybdate-binding protein